MTTPSTWRDQACLTTPPSLHEPRTAVETKYQFKVRIKKAQAVCATCTYAPTCLASAAETKESGIRAGFLLHAGQQAHDYGWAAPDEVGTAA